MKKLIFTLISFLAIHFTHAQTTYYWVGGTAGSWTDAGSWSSTVGGSGGARSAPAADDILVFDGTNIGGAAGTIAVQPATETIGTLKVLNAADLALQRTSAGTTYLTIGGISGVDLIVDATSKLRATGDVGTMAVVLSAAATGEISGQVFITGTASNRFAVAGTNGLYFLNGSTCTGGSATAAFSTTTTGTNPSVDKAVVFTNGSTYIYKGGSNPFGGSSFNIIQFETGSTFVFEATIASGILSNGRVLSNLTVRNNTTVAADGNPFNIDNILVESGSTLNMRVSGTFPVSGNIVNNGTFGATTPLTTNNLIIRGTTPQTISGTGTFTAIGALSVSSLSEVILQKSLVLNGTTSSTVTGKINLGTNTLTGTNNWNGKAASTTNFTGNTTAGDRVISNLSVFSGIGIGSVITGPGIPAGSIIIATSLGAAPGGTVTISKPATATATAAAFVGTNTSPTIQTANTGGVDASIAVTGTRTFGDGTNYIFDAATTAPFSISSLTTAGNVTFNAAATLNRSIDITGTLTLNSGKLTFPVSMAARITSGNAIAGGPFSSSKYIVTQVNTGTGDQAGLRIDGFTAPTLFPIGSPSNYLPVTLDPLTSSDFTLAVFEGITNDGNPNGTAMTAAQKAEVVDAVWTINRNSANTDDCDVTVNWVSSLEGSTFATLSNSQIGIARYNGTAWSVTGGSGDNTANFVTNTFNTFSPFGVGRKGVILPLRFVNFNASLTNNTVALKWNVRNEAGADKYNVERSSNGINFSPIATVNAKNQMSSEYSLTDAQPLTGVSYYRIRSVDANGNTSLTGIVKVTQSKTAGFEVYPNPVKGNILNISLTGVDESNYTVSLINGAGQNVWQKSLGTIKDNYNSSFVLPSNVKPGLYVVLIRSADNAIMQHSILIQ